MRYFFLALVFFVSIFSVVGQQLIINEISQGTGNQEYVEFVVIGNTICENDPLPCIDLRKVIFDDNNGFFATGSGVGIASGALRFSNDVFWSCIPQGTFILVYNQADPNPLLPPNDVSTTDGNCYLVLPANSPLLESTSVSPTISNTSYPPDADWGPSTGWSPILMANSGDSFMIPDLSNNGVPLHSVSWGNNTMGSIIYFAGSAAGLVFSFKNTVDNNPDNQANWVAEDIANGTPGAPNSTANDVWIGTMNPTCRQNALLNLSATNTACGGTNGTASVSVNGVSNFTIEWDNGSATPTISNLSAGFYVVTITDNSTGCEIIDSVEVINSPGTLATSLVVSPENCPGSCDGNIAVTILGGALPLTTTWTFNGNSITAPAPNQACSGNYQLTVVDNDGCTAIESATVNTTLNPVISVSNDTLICIRDTIELSASGGASVVWSTGEIAENIFVTPLSTTVYTVAVTSGACSVNESITVAVENCDNDHFIEFPNVFSPNGDGINEVFEPILYENVETILFSIYNRWGNVLFSSSEQTISWSGANAVEGTYFYTLRYENWVGSEGQKHGFFHLER
ncbi:MAG: gliding motility-associated C-terminal domain-containing protein [Bacteroidota bacterium]